MSEKSTIIDTCKDLNLEGFISCLCENDFSVLGTGTPEELENAWLTIRREYIHLMEDAVLIQAEAYRTEILYWELRYKSIVVSVNLLRKWYDESVVKGLKDHGYIFDYDINDQEKYNKDLDSILTQAKSILIHIANTRHELEELSKDVSKESTPITRIGMLSNIMNFSKFMGFSISLKDTYLDQYIAIRNLYCKELNKIKK